jgi:hypothetical protein
VSAETVAVVRGRRAEIFAASPNPTVSVQGPQIFAKNFVDAYAKLL